MVIIVGLLLFFIGIPIAIVAGTVIYILVKDKKEKKQEENTNDEITVNNLPSYKNMEEGLVKRMRFPVVGLNYENRRNKLKSIINEYKKADLFRWDSYDGLTNKEIIEDYFTDKIYEISEGLPGTIIEKEDNNPYDPNALKVMVLDLDENKVHIGYVPKEYCEEIRKNMEVYRMLVASSITGGKYKEVVDDEYGNEKVKIFNSEYGLQLSISFWENEV